MSKKNITFVAVYFENTMRNFLLTILILLFITASAFAKTYKVTASKLNVRNTPDKSGTGAFVQFSRFRLTVSTDWGISNYSVQKGDPDWDIPHIDGRWQRFINA